MYPTPLGILPETLCRYCGGFVQFLESIDKKAKSLTLRADCHGENRTITFRYPIAMAALHGNLTRFVETASDMKLSLQTCTGDQGRTV